MADQPSQTTIASNTAGPGEQAASAALATNALNLEPLPEDGEDLEADSDDADSSYGESVQSGSTSLRSSIIQGIVEHGRRYQSTRDNSINIPSDAKQFESMEAGHMAYTILESQQENPYFRSPISAKAQHIIDLGTGPGGWVGHKYS